MNDNLQIISELPLGIQEQIGLFVRHTRYKEPIILIFKNPCKYRLEIYVYNKSKTKFKELWLDYSTVIKARNEER